MKSVAVILKTAIIFSVTMVSTICAAANYNGPIKHITVYKLGSGVTNVAITVLATKTDVLNNAVCETFTQGVSPNAVSFYSFQMPDNDVQSRAWFSQLQIAKASGKNVSIEGTGSCAGPAYETLDLIMN